MTLNCYKFDFYLKCALSNFKRIRYVAALSMLLLEVLRQLNVTNEYDDAKM